MKQKVLELLEYIESKNSHGRVKLFEKCMQLGLGKSDFAQTIYKGPTSVGKTVVKGILLYSLVNKLKD